MLYPDLYESTLEPKTKLERDLYTCDAGPQAVVAAYVSKMFAVPAKDLPENRRRPVTADEMRKRAAEARAARAAAASEAADAGAEKEGAPIPESATPAPGDDEKPEGEEEGEEVILGFARLYAGTLCTGRTVYALLPKYDASYPPTHPKNAKHLLRVTVQGLYTMMGRELMPVERVSAGNVFAIRGLEGKVWRNATLCAPSEQGVGELGEDGECLVNLGGASRGVRALILHLLPGRFNVGNLGISHCPCGARARCTG
jgi:ribosome assembly protein 1